jgi:hypothetical protein
MIIVKLMGGLGNQMFQYAMGRSLAHRHNTQLKLDLSFLESTPEVTTPRVYELEHFNITGEIATPLEVAEFTGKYNDLFQSALVKMRRLIGLSAASPFHYVERHFHFDPAVLDAPDNTYLEGYWQSEKYFRDTEDIILHEFVVTSEPDEWNRRMAEEIEATASFSIHVRRGDYVADKATSEYHGVCSLDYYRTAVDMIVSQIKSPHFFVFSDDPAWVKENLELRYPVTFMDHNGPRRSHEDLRLMSLCKHHIIANSSFSWWGAWLCRNPNKIVIAPERWFNDTEIDTKDLLPERWIRIARD